MQSQVKKHLLNYINTKLHQLKFELTSLWKSIGFLLHKWSSNFTSFLNQIQTDPRVTLFHIHQNQREIIKILGHEQQTSTNLFVCKVSIVIKLNILTIVLLMFDPMVLRSSIVLRTKILIQSLWLRHFDWYDPLPILIRNQCCCFHFRTTINSVNSYSMPYAYL